MKPKKILITILGIFLMAFGVYGIIVWWWPLFLQLFLGALGLIIFLAGVALFLRGRSIQ